MEDKKKLTIANACNSHLHIIDPAFPNDGKAESQRGTVQEYQALAGELGLTRAVFVQAKPFGTDNACLLDALAKYGLENSRGIAVVWESVTDAELERLHQGGVRGLRFSVWNPNNAVVSFEECLPLAERTKEFGWNTQLHMGAAQLVQRASEIEKLPGKVVIDHMGRLDPKLGTEDPAFAQICRWIDKGNTWVKLCGPYLNTQTGYPWEDAAKTARAFAAYAPERVLWGTDYPHVTEKEKLDEWKLLETIDAWFDTEKQKELALVKNPEEVYGFEK